MKRQKQRERNTSSSKQSLRRVSSSIAVRKLKTRQDLSDHDKILQAIKQFLIQKGFSKTAQLLRQERSQSRPKQSAQLKRVSLLQLFEKGKRDQFFCQLRKFLKKDGNQSDRKFEFQCQLYFYIYKVNPLTNHQSIQKQIDHQSLQYLNNYLRHSGNEFIKNPQLLIYYALPFMPRPQDNPAVKHIFTKGWLTSLRDRVQAITFQSKHDTQIQNWFYKDSQGNAMKQRQLQNKNKQLGNIIQQVAKRCNHLRQSYQELIQNSKLSLADSQKKWFLFSKQLVLLLKKFYKYMDAAKKGHATPNTDNLKQQLDKYDIFLSRNLDDLLQQDVSISLFDRPSYMTQHSCSIVPNQHSRAVDRPQMQLFRKPSQTYLSLDFNKLRQYITDCVTLKKPELVRVVKALRHAIIRQNPRRQRQIAVSYSSKDICFLLQPRANFHCLSSQPLRTQYLRLINVMISTAYCKYNYFIKAPGFIKMLVKVLKEQKVQSIACRAVICSLQRLSLAARVHKQMVQLGVVQMTINLVEKNSSNLSSHFVGYSTALLCNLIMNSKLKQKFINSKVSLLRMSSNLLKQNLQDTAYLIGVIYIAIGWPQIRQQFIKHGFDKQLKQKYQQLLENPNSDQNMIRQYSHVLDRFRKDSISPQQSTIMQQEFNQDDQLGSQQMEDDRQQGEQDIDEILLLKQFTLVGPDSILQYQATKTIIQQNYKQQQSSIRNNKYQQQKSMHESPFINDGFT